MTARSAAEAGSAPAPRRGLSLTSQILLGLAVGVLLGLFFGEHASVLQPLADAYIRLMQMTVLPYLSIALILGLGQLDRAQALLLAKYGLLALLVIWGLTLAVITLMPLAFPAYESAFFFSTTLLEPSAPISFVDLYIPSNPFHSLANSIVPAVTLFSAAVGVALIGVADKDRILGPLDAFMKAISRVTHFVVRLTPLGVIPIAAVAAGTMSPAELAKLQVYFVTFMVGCLVLCFVVLPLLVTALTPYRYSDVVGTARDALLTAFVTNNVFIVLPMLAEQAEALARREGIANEQTQSVPEVVVPIAFNFPTAGKLMTLLFVPFAAWLAGGPLELSQYRSLLSAGIFSYFAKAQVALPFLMDLVEIPHDLFQLYIPTTLLNGKFDSMLGAMSLFALTLIISTALAGRLSASPARLLRFLLVSAAAIASAVLVSRVALALMVDTTYTKAEALRNMHLNRSRPPMAVYHRDPPPVAAAELELDTMERIRNRRTLRVGFIPDRLPFAFQNASGELVGFDIEMAAQMAEDLGVGLELVSVELSEMESRFASKQVDVVTSIPYTQHTLRRLRLSEPYFDATIGLLVRDTQRDEFKTVEAIRAHDGLTIGVIGERVLSEDYLQRFLGDTPYEVLEYRSWHDVFDGRGAEADAVMVLAEAGMAWSLMHPEYSVVIPGPEPIRRPLAFGTDPDSTRLARYIDEWLTLQQARGNVQQAYDYWILGRGAEARIPRWSIGHDVLGLW